MAKELAKFETTYKQLSKKAASYSDGGITKQKKLLKLQYCITEEGCVALADAVADAQSRGIVSKSMAAYLKDKEVKSVHALVEKACDRQKGLAADLRQFVPDSEGLIKEFQLLTKGINKDLKKRGDKSKSKQDIEAMLGDIDNEVKQLKLVPRRIEDGLGPVHWRPYQKYDFEVKKMLAMKPAELSQESRTRLAPEGLRDRNRNKQRGICMTEFKNVSALCESAMNKAADSDVKGLKNDLKAAAKSRDIVIKIAKEYAGLQKDFKDLIDKSKDKGKIIKDIASMGVMAKGVESKVRGTTVTIKKAGVK